MAQEGDQEARTVASASPVLRALQRALELAVGGGPWEERLRQAGLSADQAQACQQREGPSRALAGAEPY